MLGTHNKILNNKSFYRSRSILLNTSVSSRQHDCKQILRACINTNSNILRLTQGVCNWDADTNSLLVIDSLIINTQTDQFKRLLELS